MKRLLPLFIVLFFSAKCFAQIPSDCNVPSELREAYDKDVKGLVIKRMQALNSPDFDLIDIPQIWQDSILEGMAAIYNLTQLAERDSVFNLYCVHDVFSSPAVYGMIIGVETNSPIAQAWSSGEMTTGNDILDNLLTQYSFTLQNYFSFGAGVFYSDKIINQFALGDSLLNSVDGITYVEPDYLIGGAGTITYSSDASGTRYYDFRFEWNDCFDGCDNYYTWKFSVTDDCVVTFLGTETDGVFGIESLPDPVNCGLTNSVELLETNAFQVYPNPANTEIYFKNAPIRGQWQLFSLNGKLLQNGVFDQQQVFIGQLPKGMYWLRWSDDKDQVGVHRFIKQ